MNNEHSADISQQLGSAPVGKLLLKLAVPTVVAQLVNLLYNIVDRIYIGHMPEEGLVALTGVGLCFPVIYLIGAFTMLIAHGDGRPGRAALSHQHSEGRNEIDHREAQPNARQSRAPHIRDMPDVDPVHNVIEKIDQLRHHRGNSQLQQQFPHRGGGQLLGDAGVVFHD